MNYENVLILPDSQSSQSDQFIIQQHHQTNICTQLQSYLNRIMQISNKKLAIISNIYQSPLSSIYSLEQVQTSHQYILKIDQNTSREAQILQKLQKSNQKACIVKIICSQQNWILLQKQQSSLSSLIHKNKVFGLTCQIIDKMFVQICSALQIVHINGQIHGDIKPHNILYSTNKQNNELKFCLCDFGNSFRIQNQPKLPTQTLQYRAPQQFLYKKNEMSIKIDIWGMGCILYQCITGFPLIQDRLQQQLEHVTQVDYKQIVSEYHKQQRIRSMLQRFSTKDKRQKYQQIIINMLKINPQERIDLQKLQQFFKIKVNAL